MTDGHEGWPLTGEREPGALPAAGLPLLPPFTPLPGELSTPPGPSTASDFAVSSSSKRTGSTKVAVAVAGFVLLAAAVTGGLFVATDNGPAVVATATPIAANAELFGAALTAGSFHYTSVGSGMVDGHALTETQSGDAGRTDGVQYTTTPFGDGEIIVVGSTAYLKADEKMLESTLGFTPSQAAAYAGRWISFTDADHAYRAIAADVTTETTWNDVSISPTDGLQQTPQSISGVWSLNGKPVQSVRYSIDTSAAGASASGSETIDFSATQPHLPIEIHEQVSGTAKSESASGTTTVTFSRWGTPPEVVAPTGSIPFSSIPPPTTIS